MPQLRTRFPEADRETVTAFTDCLFRYADEKTYVNLRAFHDLKDGASPLFVEPVKIGAPDFIERVCERIREAGAHAEPFVFCPPICTFSEPNGAATENLAEGVALSVECDANGEAARKRLTSILGVEPTVTVASGGTLAQSRDKQDRGQIAFALAFNRADARCRRPCAALRGPRLGSGDCRC
jgi:hypothetical protein